MWKDPVVEETRAVGQQLASEAGNDVHVYFERLRRAQARYAVRVVERVESHQSPTSQNPSGATTA